MNAGDPQTIRQVVGQSIGRGTTTPHALDQRNRIRSGFRRRHLTEL